MSKQNPTIMVVEDEVLLLQAITKKLKLSGIDVLSCSSGQQAIDYLNNLDELPDAVWLDYYLKDMNGLAFMQKMKENSKWANIPVVVVSNSASPEKVNNMIALGAKKYLLKAEYRLDEIIKILKDFIANDSEVSAPSSIANPSPTATITTPVAAPNTPVSNTGQPTS
ncbi:MAG TPA: response regulator [Methylomirabilota bacterium]|nr:response regulator [Methylomirabilota bacterium]